MTTLLTRFVHDSEGQDLIEYALLAGGIALAVAAVIANLGTQLNSKFDAVNTSLSTGS